MLLEICSCPEEGVGVKRVMCNFSGNRRIQVTYLSSFKITVFNKKSGELKIIQMASLTNNILTTEIQV